MNSSIVNAYKRYWTSKGEKWQDKPTQAEIIADSLNEHFRANRVGFYIQGLQETLRVWSIPANFELLLPELQELFMLMVVEYLCETAGQPVEASLEVSE